MTQPAQELLREALDYLHWPFVHDSVAEMEKCAECKLNTAISAHIATGGWMPIETAPKDGTHVLLGVAGKQPVRGFYSGSRWLMHSDGNNIILLTGAHQPTHWRELPTPPKEC